MSRPILLTDEEILARAGSIFVERGYAVRTKEIAATVGLTWGALALRFGSKRALFNQAMEISPRAFGQRVCEPEDEADLPHLLQRLRSHVGERWPRRLQVRLASTTTSADDEAERLVQTVAAALGALARRGWVRTDMTASALAQVVLTLMTGEAAQRFVARERAVAADLALIDGVVRLLFAK